MNSPTCPTVSVILPTYNRAAFLAEAVASIRAQTCQEWELIVVDDGSTDNTREVIDAAVQGIVQPVKYVARENGGAYAARNTGLEHASGQFIAFFDSDDLWLPHHLHQCVRALVSEPKLDWVYGSCRMIEHDTSRIIDENNFYPNGEARPFLRLRTRQNGDLRILTDPDTLTFQLRYGLYAGLQNSVIRRHVFTNHRFAERFRVVEDVMFLIRALAQGCTIGYYMDPHVVYRVHGENSSASGTGTADKSLAIFRELVDGYEDLSRTTTFTKSERRALHWRLSGEYFWHLGYQGLWKTGRRTEALAAFRRGLALSPWDLRCWKTYVLAVIRTYATPLPSGSR